MNIEHFTEKAREALSDADEIARQYNHSQVDVEHLLAALLAQQGLQRGKEGMLGDFLVWGKQGRYYPFLLERVTFFLTQKFPIIRGQHRYI